jgi:hypothetical protein
MRKLIFLILITIFTIQIMHAQNDNIKQRVESYKKVTLNANLSWLSEKEKKIIPLFIKAAEFADKIFWKQNFGDKKALLSKLSDEYEKEFVRMNYGPWDILNDEKPFIKGFGEKPPTANFYPADMTKADFEKIKDPNKTGAYSIVIKDKDGYKVVPYSKAYSEEIQKIADLLKEASELAENPGLKTYLSLRVDALLTDNYQPSDMAWMDMKSSNIDFVVGPIENYTDKLFGYKTSFEAYVLIKDPEWSKKLERFTGLLPELQKGLPVDEKYKSENPGSGSDLNAYDAIYYAGDCNAGGKTIAINLPNDEEVQMKKGSRRLQLKNIMKAKFDNIMAPISELMITPEQRKYVKFNAFFENTMFHEVAHGLGIKNTINGRGTVRDALKEQNSALEEGKADILGLYIVTKLYEMGELKEGEVIDNYVTFLAGILRSCRFGAADAHGKANMVRFYYFEDKKAFTRNSDGTYSVNFDNMKDAVISSSAQILKLQGDGDYDGVKALIEKDGFIKEELKKDLDRINSAGIPLDIVFEQGLEYLKF